MDHRSGIDSFAAALVRPVEVLGAGHFATKLAGVEHVEVFAMGALYVELDGLGPAEKFATNVARIVSAHVVSDEFLQVS